MKLFICVTLFLWSRPTFSQKEVSITIDDVPNVDLYHQAGKSLLLEKINQMNIPVAIFINEKNIYKNAFKTENLTALNSWLTNKNITAGNHSYSHLNYADTTLKVFQQDIIEGERLTFQILKRRPEFFRFPFNSLGDDSIEHTEIKTFLKERGYTHAPFTIESEDWAYNAVYERALKDKNTSKAKEIGQHYITHTLLLFDYFEQVTNQLHGRAMRHIYLCHDNQLNTDYLVELIQKLREKKYKFISLTAALEDNLYKSKDYYYGRYGFSWLYRWEKDEEKRKIQMRNEPSNEALQKEYQKLDQSK